MVDSNLPDKLESSIIDKFFVDEEWYLLPQRSKILLTPKSGQPSTAIDEDLLANSSRAWVIGVLLVVVSASMHTFGVLSIVLGALSAQIIAWPLDYGRARAIPRRQLNTFALKWVTNSSSFNIKEHSIIVVMTCVIFSAAYTAFYKQDFGTLFQFLLAVSTESMGYDMVGMMRDFLVYILLFLWSLCILILLAHKLSWYALHNFTHLCPLNFEEVAD